jgi:hypothetical protein
MRRTTRASLLSGVLIIASIVIAIVTIGCKNDSPAPTPTPLPSVVATPTPTAQPTFIATPTQTPASTKTAGPTAALTSTPIPTPIPTPTPTTTPPQAQTTVSINTSSTIKQGSLFTIDIRINNVSYMAAAGFDLNFNSSCIAYVSCNATSRIGTGNGTVDANAIQSGLLRIIVDYSDYAAAHSGNGINGSGYLCKLTFNTTAQGTSQLAFASGQGNPEGKLTLVKWAAYNQSEIENVSWTNSSIIVVKN